MHFIAIYTGNNPSICIGFPKRSGLGSMEIAGQAIKKGAYAVYDKPSSIKGVFDNICKLVEAIPTYLLHISKNGSFWKEIEKVLPES